MDSRKKREGRMSDEDIELKRSSIQMEKNFQEKVEKQKKEMNLERKKIFAQCHICLG